MANPTVFGYDEDLLEKKILSVDFSPTRLPLKKDMVVGLTGYVTEIV